MKKPWILVLLVLALIIALLAGMYFFRTHTGFIFPSVYDAKYDERVMSTDDPEQAEALSDLVQACSFAYTTTYGGEVTDAFITVGCGYDAWANFYALIVQPDGDMYCVSFPFDYYDAALVYEAFDGRYHQEHPDYYMELCSELALNRMLDVSVCIIDQQMAIAPPHFTSVQAEEELARKLESGEIVHLEAPAVENLNTLLDMQEINYLQVQEAFVTSYSWQQEQWFLDRSYEVQPTRLWIRSIGGHLYSFEVPFGDGSHYVEMHFANMMNEPDSWFIFKFANNGELADMGGPVAPGAFHP